MVEVVFEFDDQRAGFGQKVLVEHVFAVVRNLRLVVASVGVEREEVIGVPERQEHLANTLANALLGDDQVSTAKNRAR